MLSGNKVLFLELEEAQPSLVLTPESLRASSPLGGGGGAAWLFPLMSWERVQDSGPWRGLSPGQRLVSCLPALPVGSVQPAENQLWQRLLAVPQWAWRGLPCPFCRLVRGRLGVSSCTTNGKAFWSQLSWCRTSDMQVKAQEPINLQHGSGESWMCPSPTRGGHGFAGRLKCRRDSATCKLSPLETRVVSGTAPTP